MTSSSLAAIPTAYSPGFPPNAASVSVRSSAVRIGMSSMPFGTVTICLWLVPPSIILRRTALLTAMIVSLNLRLTARRTSLFGNAPGVPSMQCFVQNIFGTHARFAAILAVILACVCTISGFSFRNTAVSGRTAFGS